MQVFVPSEAAIRLDGLEQDARSNLWTENEFPDPSGSISFPDYLNFSNVLEKVAHLNPFTEESHACGCEFQSFLGDVLCSVVEIAALNMALVNRLSSRNMRTRLLLSQNTFDSLSLDFGLLDSPDGISWPDPKCVSDNSQDPHSSPVHYCTACDEFFCDKCWNEERSHKRNLPHERTNPEDAVTVYTTLGLDPRKNKHLQNFIETLPKTNRDRVSDGEDMWFGVSRNQDGDCLLSEGLAYEELILENPVMPTETTIPGVVSFIGDTGAGKSALINLLIKFSKSSTNLYPTPRVGTSDNARSTSSNVHLYADPDTYLTESPILYADCEGMGGDENPAESPQRRDSRHDEWIEAQQRPVRFNRMKIDWGEKTEEGHPLTRQYMVKTLFPRILYAFSDVVLYMPINRRGKEDMLVRLIEWAHIATEQSYNKPALPHLIIAYSTLDGSSQPEDYDVAKATQNLLGMLDVDELPKLKQYINYWQKKDGQAGTEKMKIGSAEELLRFYYASVSVVNFPNQTEPTRMHDQTKILYQQITKKRKESQKYRADVWMRMNAATFPLYVRKAFTHFASSSQEPFDFYEAWFKLHPITFDFRGAIFTLAKQVRDLGSLNGMKLWKNISGFVASCLLLNYVREEAPDAKIPQRILKKLGDQCDLAADDYWKKYWPCKFQKEGWGKCVNGPSPHLHHQSLNHGNVRGDHDPSHNSQELQKEFRNALEQNLNSLVHGMGPADDRAENLRTFSKTHRQNTKSFYQSLGDVGRLLSYQTCLSCLNRVPEHCLPCGHVICGACVTESGEAMDGGFMRLKSCPLTEHDEKSWVKPWIGPIKPEQAGLRIMTLDGGGIKGIVELEILKEIQGKVGGIPLREFFDLIVGTSAGGIIACGLGPAGLSVSDCAKRFVELSSRAFSKSGSSKVPVIGEWLEKIASLFNHGLYKTEPLENALKEAFPENLNLLGGSSKSREVPVKIAVTTTTPQSRVVVLGNYNRKPPKHAFYDFHRPNPMKEMKLWEAARATSAAPIFFTPFPHSRSAQVYLDGGLYHNNPVKIAETESKAIWPTNKHVHPDILLSIGTGYHKDELGISKTANSLDEPAPGENLKVVWPTEQGGYLHFLASIAYGQVMNSLNCERIWHEWLETRAPSPQFENRYRRLTVEFEDSVKMDDATPEGIEACRTAATSMVKKEEALIRNIAHQMIASCFFFCFDQERIKKRFDGDISIVGTLQCRLLPESVILLGQHLRSLNRHPFKPHFLVKEVHEKDSKIKRIPRETIDAMISDGTFNMGLDISVSSLLAETEVLLVLHSGNETVEDAFHISGFPRKLQDDYSVGSIKMAHHRTFRSFARVFRRRPSGLPSLAF